MFDELWSIDLGKLDGVKEIFRRELEDWQGSDVDEESDDEDEEDDESDSGSETQDAPVETPATSVAAEDDVGRTDGDDAAESDVPETVVDTLPHPRPFEALRDFFSRTSNEWQESVIEAMKYDRNAGELSIKEIRKKAFDQAESRW